MQFENVKLVACKCSLNWIPMFQFLSAYLQILYYQGLRMTQIAFSANQSDLQDYLFHQHDFKHSQNVQQI